MARFLGSLLIAPRVSDPSRLISVLRILALLTLLFVMAFWAGSHVAWLMAFRMAGERFLCLEPQTHPVNAHNLAGQPGLRVLGQGDRLHFSLQIVVSESG